MFYQSSKHHFDIMFVIFCVIAGATSHNISNTSKTSINQLNNHYRASFIDFILDAGLNELLKSSNTIDKDLAVKHSSNYKSTATKTDQQSLTLCALLSNLLSGNQMKFCHRHYDVLQIILPQVIQLTKKECSRITSDTRWNCTAFDFLLDRSNPLGEYFLNFKNKFFCPSILSISILSQLSQRRLHLLDLFLMHP